MAVQFIQSTLGFFPLHIICQQTESVLMLFLHYILTAEHPSAVRAHPKVLMSFVHLCLSFINMHFLINCSNVCSRWIHIFTCSVSVNNKCCILNPSDLISVRLLAMLLHSDSIHHKVLLPVFLKATNHQKNSCQMHECLKLWRCSLSKRWMCIQTCMTLETKCTLHCNLSTSCAYMKHIPLLSGIPTCQRLYRSKPNVRTIWWATCWRSSQVLVWGEKSLKQSTEITGIRPRPEMILRLHEENGWGVNGVSGSMSCWIQRCSAMLDVNYTCEGWMWIGWLRNNKGVVNYYSVVCSITFLCFWVTFLRQTPHLIFIYWTTRVLQLTNNQQISNFPKRNDYKMS